MKKQYLFVKPCSQFAPNSWERYKKERSEQLFGEFFINPKLMKSKILSLTLATHSIFLIS